MQILDRKKQAEKAAILSELASLEDHPVLKQEYATKAIVAKAMSRLPIHQGEKVTDAN